MIPSFLITFREVIEATLIVATILGILVKFNQRSSIRTVWYAVASACLVSIVLLAIGSMLGIAIQQFYTGYTEKLIEGALMIISALFITWAVFVLHTFFSTYKTSLLQTVTQSIEHKQSSQRNIFILVFTAVFREGLEIVLFLSTIYFSSNPQDILLGFLFGVGAGLFVSFLFFSATIRLPVYYAFRFTSIMLILFAAGLLARGVHELMEIGILPELFTLTSIWIPETTTLLGSMLKSVFGVTKYMDIFALFVYVGYITFMTWFVFLKSKNISLTISK